MEEELITSVVQKKSKKDGPKKKKGNKEKPKSNLNSLNFNVEIEEAEVIEAPVV